MKIIHKTDHDEPTCRGLLIGTRRAYVELCKYGTTFQIGPVSFGVMWGQIGEPMSEEEWRSYVG